MCWRCKIIAGGLFEEPVRKSIRILNSRAGPGHCMWRRESENWLEIRHNYFMLATRKIQIKKTKIYRQHRKRNSKENNKKWVRTRWRIFLLRLVFPGQDECDRKLRQTPCCYRRSLRFWLYKKTTEYCPNIVLVGSRAQVQLPSLDKVAQTDFSERFRPTQILGWLSLFP